MAQLSVNKTASTSILNEPGGNVDFTVEIINGFAEPLTLSALDDEFAGSLGSENSTCDLPRSIPAAGSYTCQFSAFVAGDAGTVMPLTTATGTTDSGQEASASGAVTVLILNVPPTFEVVQTPETLDLQEPGGTAVFQLQITNTSVETDPITILVPTIGGDASLISTTCEQTTIPALAPENQYQCEYTVTLSGEPGDQGLVTATVIGVDDESTDPQVTAESTVSFSDALPSLAITQTPVQTSVTEPGDTVTFTLEIDNTSSATDPLTLQPPVIDPAADVLSNNCYGEPITLAPGATESCQYSVAVSGNVGDLASVSVQVNGADDEGNPVSANATSQVSFDDALPALTLTQMPSATTIEEPGGPLEFTVNVLNDSVDTDPLLVDWPLDFSTEGSASASLQGSNCPTQPAELAAGDSEECTYTLTINGRTGETLSAMVALSAEDDEGNPVSDSANSLVTVRGTDFGDAPASYPVTLENNGARHDIVPGFSLGALIDAEANGIFSLAADGDDNTQLDDEDGVTFLDDLVPGLSSRVEIIGPVDGGVLDVWVDFNADGDWDEDEHVIQAITLAGGAEILDLAVPAGSVGGPTFARFRLSETGLNTPGGEGGPGEVEDYPVTIQGVAITVTKAATPVQVMEPGAVVTFTVVVKNEGDAEFELVRLDDELYGDVSNEPSCSLPQTVPANGQYQCAFGAEVTGNAGTIITNTVVAEATVRGELVISDDGQTTVEITNASPSIQVAQTPTEASVDEPGGTVSFQLTVSNTSMAGAFDPITLTEILIDPAGGVSNNTCTIPSPTILPEEPYTCSYDITVTGNVGDSVPVRVAVSGVDDEGQEAIDTASSTVTFDDVAPSLALTLEPDTATVQQPGGPVSFTLTVSNTSVSTDPLDIAAPEITATIDGEGSASVQNATGCTAASLPADAAEDYSCTFEILVENAVVGDSVQVAVTVSGTDDESNPVSESTAALITVSGIDYGDAPESYPTVGESAASHDIRLDFLLGELIDAEAGGQPSADADADDLTDLDDEDGITLQADSLIPGLSASLEVVGPEGGVLDAWVDFNADGNWDEDEHVIEAATLSADTDTLSLPVPAGATSGMTFARFRLSEAGVEFPAGPGGPGEVEDYQVEIETLGLTVAKTATPETVPEPGDDVSFEISVQNTSSVPVELTNLDDDLQGDLNGQGDCVLPQTLDPEGIYDCAYTAPISGPPDTTVTNMVTAVASIDDLEISAQDTATVEILGLDPTLAVDLLPDTASLDEPGGGVDFSVAVENTSSTADPVTILPPVLNTTGTVSDNTCTASASIPPGETYNCDFRVTVANSDAGTVIPVTVTVTGSDDEGAEVVAADTSQVEILDVLPSVELTQTPAEILVDQAVGLAQFTVTVRNTSVATDPITLDSITPSPSGEASATVENNTCAAGIEVLPGTDQQCSYDLRVTGEVGQALDADLDLVFSDDDGNSDTASTSSLVTITGTDHGDAPDSYPTLVENGGPTHTISPDFYLGMQVDAETDGLPSDDAQGDDVNNLDDEDGITFLEPLRAGGVVSLQAMVANEEGTLSAWMDFNQDGDWDDPGEKVLDDQGAGPGSTTLDIFIPPQALPGETFARFRLTRNSSVGVGGPAPDGEVEDYAITVEAAYDLALTKSASPDPLGLDQPLTYTLTVANAGPNDASGGTITDTLPAGVVFLGSEDGCTANAGTVSCPLGPLPAEEIAQIRFQVEVTDNTLETIENTATLVSNEADADPTNNEATAMVTLDVVAPTVVEVGSIEPTEDGELGFCETAMVPITGLEVGFSEPMAQSGEGSVTLPGNYQVIGAGPDQDIETMFCGEVQGDDQTIPIDGVSYDAASDTATLSLNGGTPLPDQAYFLLACPGLSDLAGNPLDSTGDGIGGEEYLLQFRSEQDNLFRNGNLDCDLAGWIRGSQSTVWAEDDVDDALISGSAWISQSGPNFALNQCVVVTGGERYTVATQAQVLTNEPVTVEKRCDFYPQAGCNGTAERRMDGEVLEDTDLQWVLTEATFNAPPQALSARCGYVVKAPLNTSFDVYLDKLLLRLGGPTEPLIFSDGFE